MSSIKGVFKLKFPEEVYDNDKQSYRQKQEKTVLSTFIRVRNLNNQFYTLYYTYNI